MLFGPGFVRPQQKLDFFGCGQGRAGNLVRQGQGHLHGQEAKDGRNMAMAVGVPALSALL